MPGILVDSQGARIPAGFRELRNNGSGICLTKTTTAVIRKVVGDIAGIRNKAMLN